MNVNTENKEMMVDNNFIDFEIETTKYRIGKTDKYIEINTDDINLPVRLEEACKNIDAYFENKRKEYGISEVEDVFDSDKLGSVTNSLEAITAADLYVREQINYAFDSDVCTLAFGKANCMSVCKDKMTYYYENFLNAMMKVIEKEYNIKLNAVSSKARAYINKKG